MSVVLEKIILSLAILLLLFFGHLVSQGRSQNIPLLIPTKSPLLSPTPSPLPTNIPAPTETPLPSPTPLPTPIPSPLPITAFESYFDQFSTEYNANKDLLKKIAFCESGMSPGARNGVYGGMYQFTVETWKATREQMGKDTNPDLRFGAQEAIETAAYKIGHEGKKAWLNCL